MKLLRWALLIVAAGGCGAPPSSIRTGALADAGGAAGSENHDASPTDGPREGGAGGEAGTATAGSGGAGGQAGISGGAGTTGSATDVGQDGAAPLDGTPLATFDSDLNGFVIDTYHDTSPLTNLADPVSGLPAPSLIFDATVGSPNGGSMRVVAPYSEANQYVDLQKVLGTAGVQNWTGKKLHVRLRVDSGSIFAGIAQLYVDTTIAYVFAGTSFGVAAGSDWQELVLDLNAPAVMVNGYDPSEVILFGVQLETPAADTGATPATFHIDSFSLE